MTGMERKSRLDRFLFCFVWSLLSAVNPAEGQDTDLPRVPYPRRGKPTNDFRLTDVHGNVVERILA